MISNQKYKLSNHSKIYEAKDIYRDYKDIKYLNDKFVYRNIKTNKYYVINSVIKDFLSLFIKSRTFNSAKNDFIKQKRLENNEITGNRIINFFECMVSRGILTNKVENNTYKAIDITIPTSFKIKKKLNESSFLAINTENDQKVFIKYLPDFHRSTELRLWYNLLKRIKSNSIIKPVEEKIYSGFLVFEQYNLPTVMEYTRNCKLSLTKRITLIKNLINIVAEFHDNNLIHGDINSSNFLVKENLDLLCIDLITVQDVKENILITSGTPDTLPPEKLSPNSFELVCKHSNNFKSDIYQMGVLVYEILYGHPPFNGSTWKTAYYNKKKGIYTLNSETSDREKVPTTLSNILQRSLEPDPLKRYSNCIEVKQLTDLI